MTSPGRARSAARWIVRSGAVRVPGLESFPATATWISAAWAAIANTMMPAKDWIALFMDVLPMSGKIVRPVGACQGGLAPPAIAGPIFHSQAEGPIRYNKGGVDAGGPQTRASGGVDHEDHPDDPRRAAHPLRRGLDPPGDQCPPGELHDRPDPVGDLRRDRGHRRYRADRAGQ